ncbi:MAG: class I SAM-dependent methyltransferase [bacterium]
MKNVTICPQSASLYEEPDSKFYRFKRKLTLKPVLKEIRKIVKKNQAFSLLEIGTGSGFLMTFLESEFPQAKLTGLEYDARLVSLTKSKVKNARIVQGNAEGFDFNNETFDIIVSLQVIEHLNRPELMLSSVRKHLKHGGIFIFTTPNLSSYSARVMKGKWHAHREDHVSLKKFSEWKSFVEKNRFTSIYCGSTFFTGIPVLNKFPLGIINWGLLFLIGNMRWKYGESFMGIFKLSYNKGKNNANG